MIVLPALVTLAALAVAVASHGGDGGDAIELRPAPDAAPALEPDFGEPLTDVFSASDAAPLPEGWAVLDGRGQRLVLLAPDGRPVARAGRPGEGPNELSGAAQVAWLDSAVAVVDRQGRWLHLFRPDGSFRSRVPLEAPECALSTVDEALGVPGGVVLLRACTRADGTASALVERVDASGTRSPMADHPLGDLSSGTLEPGRFAMLTELSGTILLSMAPDPCVRAVGPAEAFEPLCHPDPEPVPLPDSIREAFAALGPRARATGTNLVIPDRYPAFDGLLSVGGRLAFRVVLPGDRRALDRVWGDGLERFLLPRNAAVFAGPAGLLFARDLPGGTAFAVVPPP